MYRHPYHLVDLSPWPLAASAAVFAFALSMIGFMTTGNSFWSLVALIVVAVAWWRDVIRESAGGFHTRMVVRGIMIGALLFYLSEIMLFFSFFWANLHSALSPGVELANSWPPRFVQPVDPWAIPFLGSIILLASGFTFTCTSHYSSNGKILNPDSHSSRAQITYHK